MGSSTQRKYVVALCCRLKGRPQHVGRNTKIRGMQPIMLDAIFFEARASEQLANRLTSCPLPMNESSGSLVVVPRAGEGAGSNSNDAAKKNSLVQALRVGTLHCRAST